MDISRFTTNGYEFRWWIEGDKICVSNETVGETEYHTLYSPEYAIEQAFDIAMEMYQSYKQFLRVYQ